jgi:hypothetical protein
MLMQLFFYFRSLFPNNGQFLAYILVDKRLLHNKCFSMAYAISQAVLMSIYLGYAMECNELSIQPKFVGLSSSSSMSFVAVTLKENIGTIYKSNMAIHKSRMIQSLWKLVVNW